MVGGGCQILGLIARILISAPLLQQGGQDPALERFYSANALYNRGLYELAAEEFAAFLKERPKHAKAKDARFGLGLSFFGMGKHKEAEPILSKLAGDAKFSRRVSAHTVRGQVLLELGREEEAAKSFVWSLEKATTEVERRAALGGLVESRYRQGRWKELIEEGNRLLKLGGVATDRIAYQIAEARFESGAYAEAARALEAWLKAHQDSLLVPHARFLSAECRLQTDDLRRAGKEFQALAREKDGLFAATALWRLGYVRFLEGRHDDAVRELTSFLTRFPKDESVAQARLYLGRAHLEKGRHDPAAAEFTLALKDRAVSSEASLWLARTRAGQGRHAEAEKAIADRLDPKSPILLELYEELGRAQLAQGKFGPASESMDRAVRTDPEAVPAELLWLAAHAGHRAERYGTSLTWCERFMKAHADHPRAGDVSFLRAENLFLTGKIDAAEGAYTSFTKERPKHAQVAAARFRLGQTAFQRRNWKAALERMNPLLKRTPKGDLFESVGFLVGECHFNLGSWESAIVAYGKFVVRNRKGERVDTARLRMAHAYGRKGDRPRAIKELERLIADHPESSHRKTAFGELGRLSYEAKNFGRARAALLEARRAGDRLQAPYYLGWVALAERKESEAVARFKEAAEGEPKEVLAADAALQYGVLQIRRSKFSQARVALERAIETHPGFSKANEALHALGLALARLKKWDAAIQRFRSVTKDHPESASAPQALYEWAWCEREAGRAGEARKRYAEYLERHSGEPLAARVALELAELEFDAGEIGEAEKRLEALVAAGPGKAIRPRALYRLGRCRARRKAWGEAAKTFEAILIGDGDSDIAPRAAFQAGEARLRLKEHEAALAHFRKAPGEQGLLRRAECEALTGRWKESEASCAEFLKRFPGSDLKAQARFGLGWAVENQGRPEAAVAEYRKVVEAGNRGETSARSQFQIGECLFALKKYDEAIKELIKVEVNYDFAQWRSRALLEIGRVLEAQDRKGEAAARYREVLRKYGDLEAAAVARQLLEKISSKRGDP